MKFSEKLKMHRELEGLLQEDLADKLDVTRDTVIKWESGEIMPKMRELVIMSELFEISLDELVEETKEEKFKFKKEMYSKNSSFEYKSKRTIKGIPLIHINVGKGLRKARGIIAIGNVAQGVISIGILAIGGIAIGAIGIGLISIAALAFALLALGGVAIGGIALGGLALGIFAVGGCAIGVYAIGGAAYASDIAAGGYAVGHIAIGDKCFGTINFGQEDGIYSANIRAAILTEFPHIWDVIVELFSMMGQ